MSTPGIMPGPAKPQRSAWRFFPWAICGALGLVIVVNVFFAYTAISTFPGLTREAGFEESNAYDHVLKMAAAEAALGWTAQVELEDNRAAVTLADKSGAPLDGAVTGSARRPIGPDETQHFGFTEVAPGRYLADAPLPEIGQWDVALVVTAQGQTFHVSHRVLLK